MFGKYCSIKGMFLRLMYLDREPASRLVDQQTRKDPEGATASEGAERTF